MSQTNEEIAKELTIAAIQHMKFGKPGNDEQNEYVGNQISELYKKIHQTVVESYTNVYKR